MYKKDFKYYLRPFGFVNNNDGYELKKQDNSILVGNNYFTGIEVIKRNQKGLITRNCFSIRDFLIFLKKNNNQKIKDLFVFLENKKRNVLNKKKKVNKNFYTFGILNITPDSFSDGGDNICSNNATSSALRMMSEGADFIDIGGESTRPGAIKISPSLEVLRILPIIQILVQNNVDISLDTRNGSTMEMGILSGAKIINDVSALSNDQKSFQVIKDYKVPIILMHMPGTPQNMMKKNKYTDVVLDVYDFLNKRISFCIQNGIKRENIIIDPGIGFGKNSKQNLYLLKNMSVFHGLGCPIMLGVSRKRFISSIVKTENPKNRLGGTLSATLIALTQGIQIHRVHDVKEVSQAIKVFEKIVN